MLTLQELKFKNLIKKKKHRIQHKQYFVYEIPVCTHEWGKHCHKLDQDTNDVHPRGVGLCLLQFVFSHKRDEELWAVSSYAMHSLGLSFLICNMGINKTPASKGCWKAEGLTEGECREGYETRCPKLLVANISRIHHRLTSSSSRSQRPTTES